MATNGVGVKNRMALILVRLNGDWADNLNNEQLKGEIEAMVNKVLELRAKVSIIEVS